MSYDGIDYGMGKTNIDTETGIRYGIIPLHELSPYASEHFEMIFDPHCPHCGNELGTVDQYNPEDYCEFDCPYCKATINDGDQYGDEPSAMIYDKDGLQMSCDSPGDVWVFKSPYTSTGTYCSPCAPGAVSLGTDGNIRAYCPPVDWFEDDDCPFEISRLIPQSAIG